MVRRLALLFLFLTPALPVWCHAPAGVAPSNAPVNAARDYLLGPGDQVSVHVLDLDEVPDRPVRIDSGGNLNLPLIGPLSVQGLDTHQLEALITERVRVYLKNPRVTVTLADFREHPLSVLGAVNTPGTRQILQPKRLYEAISEAGGLRLDAGSSIRITRPLAGGPIPLKTNHLDRSGEFYVAEVPVRSVLSAQNPEENIPVFSHDIVTVPRAEMVYVLGEVSHPGSYEIGDTRSVSVLKALAKAGGLLRNASCAHARVLRLLPGRTERTETQVDVRRILEGKNQDFALEPEDILFLPTNRGKVVAGRALEAMIGAGSGIAIFRGSR